ncbi:uncharacterized protein TNCV_1893061 [Trichonephila clavipes]|nr:uncharacterized protein TNCV_1893061 [Trichonephila clavipes]
MLPEPVKQVGLLYDRWRHHRSPSPQFMHGTGRQGNILQPPALVVSTASAHKTLEHPDLMSMCSVCIRRAFGETRPYGLESEVLRTWLPTAPKNLVVSIDEPCAAVTCPKL